VTIDNLEIIGAPVPGGWASSRRDRACPDIHWLDGLLLVIITAISLFVLALLGWSSSASTSRANPTPARFTHNTPIEVAWTVIPIIILVFIGAFSLPVLFKQLEIPEGDVTIKVTGYQWYWGYEYVDEGFDFDQLPPAAGRTRRVRLPRRRPICWPPTPRWSCRRARTSSSRSPAPT
jgi:cytochrome c oxidase subunit II